MEELEQFDPFEAWRRAEQGTLHVDLGGEPKADEEEVEEKEEAEEQYQEEVQKESENEEEEDWKQVVAGDGKEEREEKE